MRNGTLADPRFTLEHHADRVAAAHLAPRLTEHAQLVAAADEGQRRGGAGIAGRVLARRALELGQLLGAGAAAGIAVEQARAQLVEIRRHTLGELAGPWRVE